jgi:hypothetical protein
MSLLIWISWLPRENGSRASEIAQIRLSLPLTRFSTPRNLAAFFGPNGQDLGWRVWRSDLASSKKSHIVHWLTRAPQVMFFAE